MDSFDRETRKAPQSLGLEEEARAQRARKAEARKQRMKALAEKAGFGDYSTDLMRQARGVDPYDAPLFTTDEKLVNAIGHTNSTCTAYSFRTDTERRNRQGRSRIE